jgi:hypothetical protein
MAEESGINNEREVIAGPKIIYDENLSNAPYTVSVDTNLLGQMLVQEGWKTDDIRSLEVRVRRGNKNSFFEGNYSNKRVKFGVEKLWSSYEEAIEIVDKVVAGKNVADLNSFSKLLTTKRLPGYLSAIKDKERGTKFANKLLKQGLSRQLSKILLHEVGHADDKSNPNKDFKKLQKEEILHLIRVFGSAILFSQVSYELIEQFSSAPENMKQIGYVLLNLGVAAQAVKYGYLNNPQEKSAREFADRLIVDRNMDKLVNITPKNIE